MAEQEEGLVSGSIDVYEADDPAELEQFADTVRLSSGNVTIDFNRDEDGAPRLAINAYVNAVIPEGVEEDDTMEVIGYLTIDDADHARAIIAQITKAFRLEEPND